MSIVREVNNALFSAFESCERNDKTQFTIVFSEDARSEFMHEMTSEARSNLFITDIRERYMGAVIAVTRDKEEPRFAVFSRLI